MCDCDMSCMGHVMKGKDLEGPHNKEQRRLETASSGHMHAIEGMAVHQHPCIPVHVASITPDAEQLQQLCGYLLRADVMGKIDACSAPSETLSMDLPLVVTQKT